MTQNNFTILELISQSPTTSVYKAHQNVLDRIVLLKVLHRHLLRDKDLVARFSREAKACAILRSENIVQVHDLTEVDGAPAIVMEYVDGKSLEELLEDKNNHSEELLLRVATSVLRALSYAHDRGVTHRDIKPSNILISENGTIKVTDFGLATVSDSPSLTAEGSLVGTPAYMSPEQARGEAVDQRTDLFSLGVTLIEVLTGDRILMGKTYTECINKIQSFHISSIDYFAPNCSAHVFEFMKRMLAPDRHGRFASAREALEFLEATGDEEIIKPKSPASHPKKYSYGLLVGGTAVVLIAAVGLLFVFTHFFTRVAEVAADSTAAMKMQDTAGAKDVSSLEVPPMPRKDGTSKRQETLSPDQKPAADGGSDDIARTTKRTVALTSAEIDSGYISVHCNPWAKIFIDSEYAGTTPISGAMKVPIGEHTVTFNNPNFVPIVRRIRVQRNLLSNVEANFLVNSAYLLVSVEPWGDVYVDDQFRETTPSVQPIVVSAGTRRIRIHNPNFQDIVETLTVSPGDTLRLNFNFLTKESN